MNDKAPIRVAVTGAAGQIGYSLLFVSHPESLFGPDQPVALNLIEIEPGMKALEGVCMELDDCAFLCSRIFVPLLTLMKVFRCKWALLVGSVPRKAGMERGDLLGINGKIFTGQGQAIQANAASNVGVLVVGNPCNTNCLIAMNNAQDVPANRWFAMTRSRRKPCCPNWRPKRTIRYQKFPMLLYGEIILPPSILIITMPKLAESLHPK